MKDDLNGIEAREPALDRLTANRGARSPVWEERTEAELISLLVSFVPSKAHPEDLAERLIQEFGSLKGVFDASIVELTQVESMDRDTAEIILIAAELAARYREHEPETVYRLDSPRAMASHFMAKFRNSDDERLLLILLDGFDVVLGEEFLGAGTVDHVIAFPRQVIRVALRYNAARLIVAHNHPHGPPLPSAMDRDEARRLREMLLPFDVDVRDSIIVGRNRCFSIFENRPL